MNSFTLDQLKQARDAGYSDSQIFQHLAAKDPNYANAQKAGYTLDDIAAHGSGQRSGMDAPSNPNAPALPQGAPMVARVADQAIRTALPISSMQNLVDPNASTLSKIGSGAMIGAAALPLMTGGAGAALKGMAAAGATAGGLEGAGVQNPIVRAVLPAAAGILAGAPTGPKAVPMGQESNALARAVGGLGIDVPSNLARRPGLSKLGPMPIDIKKAWAPAVEAAGAEVGSTGGKISGAVGKLATTPEIKDQVLVAVTGGLHDAGVPFLNGSPYISGARGSAAAKHVMDNLVGRIQALPDDLPPSQAHVLINNIINDVKDAAKFDASVGGRINQTTTKAAQGALDALSTPADIAAHQAANAKYSQAASLSEMVDKASGGKVGPEAGFKAKDFAAAWSNMDPSERAKFPADFQKQMDYMTQQKPNFAQEAVNKTKEVVRQFGKEQLMHHPQARFYEPGTLYSPLTGAGLSNYVAGAGEGIRSATNDPEANIKKMRNSPNFISALLGR